MLKEKACEKNLQNFLGSFVSFVPNKNNIRVIMIWQKNTDVKTSKNTCTTWGMVDIIRDIIENLQSWVCIPSSLPICCVSPSKSDMVFKHNEGLMVVLYNNGTQGMRAHIATTKTADQL